MQGMEEDVLDKYPNVNAWFLRMQKEIDNYDELCGNGARELGLMFRKKVVPALARARAEIANAN